MARREGRDTEIGPGRHRAEVQTPRQTITIKGRGKSPEVYDVTGVSQISVTVSGEDYQLEVTAL